jgi:hypothetical protein
LSSKKKLIRVKALDGQRRGSNPYDMSTISFGFVSSPDPERVQASSLHTCRETLAGEAMRSFNKMRESSSIADIDFNKFRLLVVYDPSDFDKFRSCLFSGKAGLNLLENIAGWENSKITTVKHQHYKNAWLLTGPKEWMSQPQLVSLSSWLLRIAAYNGPLKVGSFKEMCEHLESLYNGSGSNDRRWCKLFVPRLKCFLENLDEIFKGMDLNKAWKHRDSFGSYSGLYSFFEGYAKDYSKDASEAYQRFRKIYERR